jgi:hypothetical protein
MPAISTAAATPHATQRLSRQREALASVSQRPLSAAAQHPRLSDDLSTDRRSIESRGVAQSHLPTYRQAGAIKPVLRSDDPKGSG